MIKMNKILSYVLIFFAIGFLFTSCKKDKHKSLGIQVGDYKELFKLSVLDYDITKAFPMDVPIDPNDPSDTRKIVYKINIHGEFKYDLNKIKCDTTQSGKRIFYLPGCEYNITSNSAPEILYEETSVIGADAKFKDDKAALNKIFKEVKADMKQSKYQQMAKARAVYLLKNFYKNTGDSVIVK